MDTPTGAKTKSIIVSFQGDPAEKPKWLQLWWPCHLHPARRSLGVKVPSAVTTRTSAVEKANVDPTLMEFRSEALAEKFNYEFAEKAQKLCIIPCCKPLFSAPDQ